MSRMLPLLPEELHDLLTRNRSKFLVEQLLDASDGDDAALDVNGMLLDTQTALRTYRLRARYDHTVVPQTISGLDEIISILESITDSFIRLYGIVASGGDYIAFTDEKTQVLIGVMRTNH